MKTLYGKQLTEELIKSRFISNIFQEKVTLGAHEVKSESKSNLFFKRYILLRLFPFVKEDSKDDDGFKYNSPTNQTYDCR